MLETHFDPARVPLTHEWLMPYFTAAFAIMLLGGFTWVC